MKADIHLTDLDPDEHEAIIHAKENAEWREMVMMEAQSLWDAVDGGDDVTPAFFELLQKIGVDVISP